MAYLLLTYFAYLAYLAYLCLMTHASSLCSLFSEFPKKENNRIAKTCYYPTANQRNHSTFHITGASRGA
jgi:hypothetical protein